MQPQYFCSGLHRYLREANFLLNGFLMQFFSKISSFLFLEIVIQNWCTHHKYKINALLQLPYYFMLFSLFRTNGSFTRGSDFA
jgi:hypothetical protein